MTPRPCYTEEWGLILWLLWASLSEVVEPTVEKLEELNVFSAFDATPITILIFFLVSFIFASDFVEVGASVVRDDFQKEKLVLLSNLICWFWETLEIVDVVKDRSKLWVKDFFLSLQSREALDLSQSVLSKITYLANWVVWFRFNAGERGACGHLVACARILHFSAVMLKILSFFIKREVHNASFSIVKDRTFRSSSICFLSDPHDITSWDTNSRSDSDGFDYQNFFRTRRTSVSENWASESSVELLMSSSIFFPT